MGIIEIVGLIAVLVGIVAGIVQVLDYLEKRHEKLQSHQESSTLRQVSMSQNQEQPFKKQQYFDEAVDASLFSGTKEQHVAPRIFISHAWEEKALVRRLEEELKIAGADVWVDHSEVRGGDNLPERISDALKWCSTLLLIWSKAAQNSHWVKLEWTNAIALKKAIIPCIVDTTEPPSIIAAPLHLDFRNIDTGIEQLLHALELARQPIHSVATRHVKILAKVLRNQHKKHRKTIITRKRLYLFAGSIILFSLFIGISNYIVEQTTKAIILIGNLARADITVIFEHYNTRNIKKQIVPPRSSKSIKLTEGTYRVSAFSTIYDSTLYFPFKVEKAESVRLDFPTGISKDMAYVPAGSFLFGRDQKIEHVKRSFLISKTETTYRDFMEFFTETIGQSLPMGITVETISILENLREEPQYLDKPISGVSFEVAEKFCAWKSNKNNLQFYIPSREEWEKAARGIDGRKYPWGNTFVAEYSHSNRGDILVAVDSFPEGVSPYGCLNMAGNVAEWTTSSDSEKPVIKGGFYGSDSTEITCYAEMTGVARDFSKKWLGFRICQEIK